MLSIPAFYTIAKPNPPELKGSIFTRTTIGLYTKKWRMGRRDLPFWLPGADEILIAKVQHTQTTKMAALEPNGNGTQSVECTYLSEGFFFETSRAVLLAGKTLIELAAAELTRSLKNRPTATSSLTLDPLEIDRKLAKDTFRLMSVGYYTGAESILDFREAALANIRRGKARRIIRASIPISKHWPVRWSDLRRLQSYHNL